MPTHFGTIAEKALLKSQSYFSATPQKPTQSKPLTIGIILVEYDFPISEVEVVGTYVNNNFDEEPFYAEVPYIKDTLKLNLDKTFTSKYYGNGIYEISSDFFGSELSLSYENKMGKGGANFPLKDKPFQPVKIMLSFDLDYYYEKISH